MNALNLWRMHSGRPAWRLAGAMAVLALGLRWLLFPTAGHAAEASRSRAAVPAPMTTATNTIVLCTNGASYLTTNAIFRGNVRVFDPQLYLECELLTLDFPTNAAGLAQKSSTGPGMGSINTIVAETNVLMMMRGATIIGDRAVYSATNDLVQIVGEIVVIDTASGYAYGTNFIFNRRTMELEAIGPSTLESKPGVSLIEGTNNLPNMPGVTRPKRNTSPPRPSGKTQP